MILNRLSPLHNDGLTIFVLWDTGILDRNGVLEFTSRAPTKEGLVRSRCQPFSYSKT